MDVLRSLKSTIAPIGADRQLDREPVNWLLLQMARCCAGAQAREGRRLDFELDTPISGVFLFQMRVVARIDQRGCSTRRRPGVGQRVDQAHVVALDQLRHVGLRPVKCLSISMLTTPPMASPPYFNGGPSRKSWTSCNPIFREHVRFGIHRIGAAPDRSVPLNRTRVAAAPSPAGTENSMR